MADYGSYFRYIGENLDETNQLLDTILIHITEFFRDPAGWEVIADHILPSLLKRLRTGDSFRAWVAGCSQAESVVGLELAHLPIQPAMREALVRRRKAIALHNTPMLSRNQQFKIRRSTRMFDVHLTPISSDADRPSLLLMFTPQQPGTVWKRSRGRNSGGGT